MELRRRGGKVTQIDCESLSIRAGSDYNQNEYDYEIGAAYLTKSGKTGVVYFGNKGDCFKSPYIELKKNKDKNIVINEERENSLEIINAGEIKKVWLLMWHHELMELGPISVPFKEDGVWINVLLKVQDKELETNVIRVHYSETDTFNEEGNMLILCEFDLTEPKNIELKNISKPLFLNTYTKYRKLVVHENIDLIKKESEIVAA